MNLKVDKVPYIHLKHIVKQITETKKEIKKTAEAVQSFDSMYYRVTNSTTVAMINRIAKKPNETAKPTPESVESLRLL